MDIKTTYSELRTREVINVCDGARLGCVCDLELNAVTGQVLAIVVPGENRLFGILKGREGMSIPYCAIKKFGEDVILVELSQIL